MMLNMTLTTPAPFAVYVHWPFCLSKCPYCDFNSHVRHGAGAVVGIGQLVLVRLSSGNGIDITSAIWLSAGRMPMVRTLGSTLLSVVIVGMGAPSDAKAHPNKPGPSWPISSPTKVASLMSSGGCS